MQNYNNNPKSNHLGLLTGFKLVKINAFSLKAMSKIGLKAEDWQYLEAYQCYLDMRQKGEKYDYIIAKLSANLGISESSVKRIIRRFSQVVDL